MRLCSLIALCLAATLWLSGQQPPQPPDTEPPAPATTSGACPTTDPFCVRLNEAKADELRHDQVQAELEQRIAQRTACSNETYDDVEAARKAAAKAHQSYLGYLAQWRELATKDTALFLRLSQSRTGLRAEVDKRISDLNQELTELDQRGQTLQAALQKAGVAPTGREAAALDKLRTNKQERLTNLKQTADRWVQARKYHAASLENAKRLETTLGELSKLTESAGDLWAAYYDSIEARVQHDCTAHRTPEQTRLGTKRPPL